MRIYVDESGTHSDDWLVIGMLFVPDHGALHSELCKHKEDLAYYNSSPKKNARYKELHFAKFKSYRDCDVASRWVDSFIQHSCFFRAVIVEWSIWQGKYFGDAFESDALKKRRAYKKWAEMLLHPETGSFRRGKLYLDHLRMVQRYDVLDSLKDRFLKGYEGSDPWIEEFQKVASWKDAHQCLQLCDLLVGCIYKKLVPSKNKWKKQALDHLYDQLKPLGVKDRRPGYWKGYAKSSLRKHFPKFSEWYWRPERD